MHSQHESRRRDKYLLEICTAGRKQQNMNPYGQGVSHIVTGQLKCDGTSAETRFRLSANRTTGASVLSTTGSRGVRISGSKAGYTMFRSSVKGTCYPLHSSVSPSLPLPCVTVCHHISAGLYLRLSLSHITQLKV